MTIFDRREYPRLEKRFGLKICEIEIEALLGLSSSQKPVYAKSLNISAGGTLVESPSDYPAGAMLRIEIGIPGWINYDFTRLDADMSAPCEPLIVVGKVVRKQACINGWRLGVSFEAIDEKHRKAVDRFIKTEISKN